MSKVTWKESVPIVETVQSVKNDYSFTANVGKMYSTDLEREFFSPETLKNVSDMITRALRGLDPQGRDIRVSNENISGVIRNLLNTYTPRTGDIYSKYQVMYDDPRQDYYEILMRAIEIITSYIRNEYEMIAANKKLSIWDTILGDFNSKGLLRHSNIKTREKRPDPFLFHMRY
jgi:hypothetical protein